MAGYGKSALLEADRPERGVVSSALALVSNGLRDGVSWIGVDDFDDIGADDQERLIRLLTDAQDVDITLASRTSVSASVRRGLGGRVSERDAGDLALTPYEIARLLAAEVGVIDPEAALRVAELTAGWPMLVHFARDALSRDSHVDLAAALTTPGTPSSDWIRTNVLDILPPGVEDVLRVVAGIDPSGPITQDLYDAVAGATGGGRPHLVEHLRRGGLLVARRRVARVPELVLVPAVGLFLAGESSGPSGRGLIATVARAYEADRAWLPAAQAHAGAGGLAASARLIAEHGESMLRRGDAGPVARLIELVRGESLEDDRELLQRTYADALRMSGEPAAARRAFAPLVARAADAWPPGLAARVAGVHYMCGEFESALGVLDRSGDLSDPGSTPPDSEDLVDWWACRVHVLAMLGRDDEARSAGAQCLDIAERVGDERCLGVAHLAVARTCRGSLRDMHDDQTLRHAAEADDAVTMARALAARTWRLMAAARYDLACVSARESARMARLCSPPGLQAASLHNLGEALARTGELEEALWHLDCSVALCRTLGPARAALGLVGVGDVHRVWRHREQSRVAYTEAAELARGSGDVQVLVAALCGQALLAADQPTCEAEEAAAEARRLAPADLLPLVLVTTGRIAAGRGDRAAAAEHARLAVSGAREVRAVGLLADALELESTVVDDPVRAREALTEALSIWAAGGAGPAVARVEMLIGQLPDADGRERSRARDAARTLQRLGISTPDRGPGAGDAGRCVSIGVLGRFAVTVGGAEVPLPAWRSKQARTLVKILAAHRGRVVTRARLCDLLWPDDDPARTGHRLSVLLATVRGVLDPAKAWPPDHYIDADLSGLRLNLGAVVIDSERLLCEASHASALIDGGDTEQAREVLTHVDELYRGEAFEGEHEEWADGLREEVRAAWVRSMRRLATLLSREGRGHEAIGILARLLTIDPYDEQVHRRLVSGLVRAGRHGEARRAFGRWCKAMQEIDAPPPDPRLTDPHAGHRRAAAVLTSR